MHINIQNDLTNAKICKDAKMFKKINLKEDFAGTMKHSLVGVDDDVNILYSFNRYFLWTAHYMEYMSIEVCTSQTSVVF